MRAKRFFALAVFVALVLTILAATKMVTKPVAAEGPAAAFVFQCAPIANTPDYFALGTLHFSPSSNTPQINPSDCGQVIADSMNAGFKLQSVVALQDGVTQYTMIRSGGQ